MAVQSAYVLVCIPAADGVAVAPCGTVGGVGYTPTTVSASLLDASMAAQLEAATGPFDYALFAQFCLYGLGAMLPLFLLSYGVGLVMKTVRES